MDTSADASAVPSSGGDRSFLQSLAILRHRFVWVVAGVAVGIGLAAAYNYRTKPVYESATLVLLQPQQPKIRSFESAYSVERSNRWYFNSQYRLVQSLAVAKAVAEAAGIGEDPRSEFYGLASPGQVIRKRIHVSPVRQSRLMRVGFQGRNPEEVKRLADEVVHAYIRLDEARRSKGSSVTLGWLTDSLPQLRKQLDAAEKALHQFKEENGILELNGRFKARTEELARLRNEVSSASLRRIDLEVQYDRVREARPEIYQRIPFLLESPTVEALVKQRLALALQRIERTHNYGPKHPSVVAIEGKIAAVKREFQTELELRAAAVKEKYAAAKAKEDKLRRLLDQEVADSKAFNRKAVRFEKLKREVEKVRRLYDPLAGRLEEVELASSLTPKHIHVIDSAELPRWPVKPRIVYNLVLGMLAGIMLGIGLAFLADYVDDKVRVPEDLTQMIQMPVMGLIPHMEKGEGLDTRGGRDLLALKSPHAPASEAFRALRTSLLLNSRLQNVNGGGRAMLITSADKAEGKTTVALNLAIVMAQAGKTVLLIDGDLRRPAIHKVLDVRNDEGLVTVISGEKSLSEVVRKTEVDGLDVLGSGPSPAQPSEMLGTSAVEEIISQARETYDWVILDSPPVVAVTDAVVLSRLADVVLQVVRSGKTSRRLVQRGRDLLLTADTRLFGAVLNSLPRSGPGYYYNYYYRYDYRSRAY